LIYAVYLVVLKTYEGTVHNEVTNLRRGRCHILISLREEQTSGQPTFNNGIFETCIWKWVSIVVFKTVTLRKMSASVLLITLSQLI